MSEFNKGGRIKDIPEIQAVLREKYAPGKDANRVWNEETKQVISTNIDTNSFLWKYGMTAIPDLTEGQINDLATEISPMMIKVLRHVQEIYGEKSLRGYEACVSPGLRVLDGVLNLDKQRQQITLRDTLLTINEKMKKHHIPIDNEMSVQDLFRKIKGDE